MAVVSAPSQPVSWQEQFKAKIAHDTLDQIPTSSMDELGIWVLANCGESAQSLRQLVPSGLTQEKWDQIFTSAVHHTVKRVAMRHLQFMVCQSACEIREEIQRMVSKKTANDSKQSCTEAETEDGFVVVELEPSTSDKIKLLKTWLKNPALVLSKEILTGSSRYS